MGSHESFNHIHGAEPLSITRLVKLPMETTLRSAKALLNVCVYVRPEMFEIWARQYSKGNSWFKYVLCPLVITVSEAAKHKMRIVLQQMCSVLCCEYSNRYCTDRKVTIAFQLTHLATLISISITSTE